MPRSPDTDGKAKSTKITKGTKHTKKTKATKRTTTTRTKATKSTKAPKATKHVYFFGKGKAEGDRSMKDVLGGKGSGLAEMTNAGLPVPPGFTISTGVCTVYYENKGKLTPAIEQEMLVAL